MHGRKQSTIAMPLLGDKLLNHTDRGCGLLSRFYTWHPERLRALVFMSVGYNEPSDAAIDLG